MRGNQDQVWAEADVTKAAAQLRRIYENPEQANLIAEQGRLFMRTHFSPEVIGARYADALGQIVSTSETAPRPRKARPYRAADRRTESTAVA